MFEVFVKIGRGTVGFTGFTVALILGLSGISTAAAVPAASLFDACSSSLRLYLAAPLAIRLSHPAAVPDDVADTAPGLRLENRRVVFSPPSIPIFGWQELASGERTAPSYYTFSNGGPAPELYLANRQLSAEEMALVMGREYGAGSILGRSAAVLASVATVYQRGERASVEQINTATGTVIDTARDLLGFPYLPPLRLGSHVTTNRISIDLRHDW